MTDNLSHLAHIGSFEGNKVVWVSYSSLVPVTPEWVSAWATVGGVVVTAIAGLITAWNAVISKGLLEETKRIRLSQIEPNVYVRLAPLPSTQQSKQALLIIENTGPGVALGVRLTLNSEADDYAIFEDYHLSDLRPFKMPIGIKPGEMYSSVAMIIQAGTDPFDGRPEKDVPIKLSYQDQIGRHYKTPILLTRDPWEGLFTLGYTVKSKTQPATLLDVANEITALREAVERRHL